jgi:hypothetical protein
MEIRHPKTASNIQDAFVRIPESLKAIRGLREDSKGFELKIMTWVFELISLSTQITLDWKVIFIDHSPTQQRPAERVHVMKPKDNLRSEGKFEGTLSSRDDYIPTKGDRYETKRPIDNLRLDGRFK